MLRAEDNPFTITRVLNHNVILVEEASTMQEVVLFGKGIGFGKKPGETFSGQDPRVEKRFRLEGESQQKQYKTLLNQVDPAVVGIAEEIIALVAKECPLANEHIHLALPDHIQFALYRLQNGLEIVNPFLFEIQTLYPREYELASRAAAMIAHTFHLQVPDSEIGFLALHIHAAIHATPVNQTVQVTTLLQNLVEMIEQRLRYPIARGSVDYIRLITHLRFAVERIRQQKTIQNPLLDRIQSIAPEAHQLAEELATFLSERLCVPVPEDEVGYMALHLYRLFQQQTIE